ncbi:MAG: hypothetical protein PQJ46_11260 [Spirochaetales bacterium]|nr:hypothetical protein [Spirochaetales bacterium]
MKIKDIFMLFLIILMFTSCGAESKNINSENNSRKGGLIRVFLWPIRTGKTIFITKDKKFAKELYIAVNAAQDGYDDQKLKELIKYNNLDLNFCIGDSGWIDSNPLDVVAQSFFALHVQERLGMTIPSPPSDVNTLNILVNANADIDRRPYIWHRVYLYDNKILKSVISQGKVDGLSVNSEEMKKRINDYVDDSNILLEAFIEAGADPDKKGHPYPYDWAKTKGRMTDEEANKYFEQGSRPINIAIEKGIVWESQVDLLLKYVKLDEESLKAAERSNDPEMIEKINRLWIEQQNKN